MLPIPHHSKYVVFFHKRHIASYCLMSLLLIVLLAGCSSPFARKVRVPRPHGPAPTAQQLITNLQQHFKDVKTFHVVMQVENMGTASGDQIQIHSADGDVAMPDKLKARASVVMSGQSVQVDMISVGKQQYITDPITSQWRPITMVFDPQALTDPETGIIALVSKVQNLSTPTSATSNGVLCWDVKGQLDAKYLAFLGGGDVPAGTMLQADACVGQSDNLPYHIQLIGQASAGDTEQTTRTFDLSNFNQDVTITAPQL